MGRKEESMEEEMKSLDCRENNETRSLDHGENKNIYLAQKGRRNPPFSCSVSSLLCTICLFDFRFSFVHARFFLLFDFRLSADRARFDSDFDSELNPTGGLSPSSITNNLFCFD